MKTNKILRTILIIMVIALVSLASFIGVYKQDKNAMINVLKEFKLGMNLAGSRQIELDVNTSKKTINYDADGNEISSSDTEIDIAKTEEKDINLPEVLTKENYKVVRKILEKRMNKLGVNEYEVRQNEENGTIVINIPEDENTDNIVAQLQYQGKFEITDNETNEVLLNNQDIKSAKAGYGTTSSGTTSIFISIQFNKEGTEKYRNVTNTYVETTSKNEETGEETKDTKKIAIKLDDTTLLTTYFDEEISNGVLQLTVGTSGSSSTQEELQESLKTANSLAAILDSGKTPVVYEMTQNKYIASEVTSSNIAIFVCLMIIVITVSMIYLIVKYKKEGILSAISLVGYVALLLLVLRYTNVVITLEGIISILVVTALFYVVLLQILKNIEKEEPKVAFSNAIKKSILILIPIYLIALVFTFNSYIAISSFGMVMFWGITINIIYNFIITRTLLIDSKN